MLKGHYFSDCTAGAPLAKELRELNDDLEKHLKNRPNSSQSELPDWIAELATPKRIEVEQKPAPISSPRKVSFVNKNARGAFSTLMAGFLKGSNALSTEIGLSAKVQIQGGLYLWLVALVLFLIVFMMFSYYYYKYKDAISTTNNNKAILRERLVSPKRFAKSGQPVPPQLGQVQSELTFRSPQQAEAVLQCGKYRFPEHVPKTARGVNEALPQKTPMCMECLVRIGPDQLYHLCLKCSEWICEKCSSAHVNKVSCQARYKTVCRHICMECSERKCGRRDCNWPESATDDQYHVCAQCVVKAIDLRHPSTWYNVVSKSHSVDSETRGYDLQSLASARIFLWIHLSSGWVLRMKKFLVDGPGLNQWCRFEHNYNRERAAETPHMLALLYSAILTFEPVTIDERRISEFFARSWEDTLIPHDRLMWYDILALRKTTKIENSINLAPNVHTDGSNVLEKFVAIAKHCDYVLTNYEMRTLNAQRCHENPLRPSISPQSDWLNQKQVSVDGAPGDQGRSTDEAATSSHPLTGVTNILVDTIQNHLPLISFFVVMIVALLMGMLSETQVSAPKQIAKS